MLISCELCAQGIDCKNESDLLRAIKSERRFTTPKNLRAHLISVHAQYVARALLEPNLNDKTHFWILATVDYSANAGTDDQSILTMTNINELKTEDKFHICRNIGPNFEKDEKLLSENDFQRSMIRKKYRRQLLCSYVESKNKIIRKTECKLCKIKICITARQRHVYMIHLRQRDLFQCSACDYTNSNSIWELRKHCTLQHIRFNETAKAISNEDKYKNSIQEWNQRCFPNWKKKLQNDNKLDEVHNASFEPKFNNLIYHDDSSTINEQNLKTIDKAIDSNNDRKNIEMSEHGKNGGDIKKQDNVILQNCPFDYDSEYSPISAFKIDWAQLTMIAKSSVNYDTPSLTINKAKITNNSSDNVGKTTYKMTSPLVTTNTPMTSNDRICHVCWDESRYPGRHIAQRHLSHHLYECPFGDGFGSYESCAVVKHIRKVHDTSNATPVNNVEQLADEIMELQKRCFPNRPMKLLRGYITDKPNEDKGFIEKMFT